MEVAAAAPSVERQHSHALLTTGLSVALGLGLSIVVARALGPAGKGLLDVASATIAFGTLVLGASLNAGITHLVARHGATPPRLAAALAGWSLAAAVATWSLLAGFPDTATRLGFIPAENRSFWTGFIVVSVGCGIWASGLRGILIGRQAVVAANRIDLGIKAALFAAYVGLAFLAPTPAAPAFALAGAAAAVLLAAVLLAAPAGPVAAIPRFWSALLATSLPLHGTNILHLVNQRADVFFVQAGHGADAVGLYTLAVSLAQIVLLASSALAVPLLPQVSAAVSEAEAATAAARTCRIFVTLALTAGAGLAVVAPWGVPAVFGGAFSGSLPALLVLLPGMVAFGLTNLLIAYFVGTGRHRLNLGVAVVTVAVTLLGNAFFTPRFGGLGAAGVSTGAYLLAGALSVGAFARRAHVRWSAAVWPTRADWQDAARLVTRFRF